jgi:hypothetical protein
VAGVTDGQALVYNSTSGDWEASTITQATLVFPFFNSSATLDTISLLSNQNLPFFKADGTQDNITVTT